MITYTATNTKTGQFYIGSSLNYCTYMSRRGYHHVGKTYSQFRKDLQEDPESFVWEYYEDDLDTREWEESLLALYVGSPYCYNRSTKADGSGFGGAKPGYSHSEETKQKMSESALKTSNIKSETLTKIVTSTKPCPHCGKLMNPGNLSQHLRRGKCR